MIATAVILVAGIVIVFFLWLISMEFKGLYDSREQFNTNVKLMGFSNRNLMELYLLEMLRMQPGCVIAGCLMGEIVYHFYALASREAFLWILPGILAAAVVIHLCMLLVTVFLIGVKRGAHSIISEIRGVRKHRRKKLPGVILQAVIAAVLLIGTGVACRVLQNSMNPAYALVYCQAVKLLYFAVIIFAFDPVMLLVFQIADIIGKKAGAYHFCLSLELQKSFWGRFKIMCFLLIFSGSLFGGLYSFFSSARNMAAAQTEENVHYQSYYIYDGMRERGAENETSFETFRYRALWNTDGQEIHIWITGVDETYLEDYETVLADVSQDSIEPWMQSEDGKPQSFAEDQELAALLEDKNFDGIIMPDSYASPGEVITLNVNGTDVRFTVYAGGLSNDFDRLDGYVSRAYLEKQLGAEGLYNTVYYLEEPETVDQTGVTMTQTKEDVWQETYIHSVQSTENVELVIWMILICCVLAICTCLVMSCTDNRRMLACLQGMGTSRRILAKIFVFQAVWNILCVILPVIGLTNMLARALCYLTNGAMYAVLFETFDVGPARFAWLFTAWFAVYTAVQLILVRRETKNGKCVEILRK